MNKYHREVQSKIIGFDEVLFSLISQVNNGIVDALARLAPSPVLSFDPTIYVEEFPQPNINKKYVMEIEEAPGLINPSKNFIETKEISEEPIEAKRIK